MLVLDKFFSAIRTATDVTKTILTISGASPPTASLTSIEGTNKNIYDELQLVNNSVLYPCQVENHTPYKFQSIGLGATVTKTFFVERNDALELIMVDGTRIIRYNFTTKSRDVIDFNYTIYPLLVDIQYNDETEYYEFSTFLRNTSPPYDYSHGVINFDSAFTYVSKSDSFDSLYYRGFNTYGLYGIEVFKWKAYFNLQFIDDLWWLSLGHKVYIFDLEWNTQRIIFLNNSFLIGEEAENEPACPAFPSGLYLNTRSFGYKSYVYNSEIYITDKHGNIERYKI